MFDLADVDANYDTIVGGGDASVWVGDFDPAAIDDRASDLANSDDVQAQRYAEQPREVSDDRYIQLRDHVDPDDVVGVDAADSALGIDGIEQITTALDDHDAYAALLLLQGTGYDVSFDGHATLDAAWERAGLAAGFESGEQYVSSSNIPASRHCSARPTRPDTMSRRPTTRFFSSWLVRRRCPSPTRRAGDLHGTVETASRLR